MNHLKLISMVFLVLMVGCVSNTIKIEDSSPMKEKLVEDTSLSFCVDSAFLTLQKKTPGISKEDISCESTSGIREEERPNPITKIPETVYIRECSCSFD